MKIFTLQTLYTINTTQIIFWYFPSTVVEVAIKLSCIVLYQQWLQSVKHWPSFQQKDCTFQFIKYKPSYMQSCIQWVSHNCANRPTSYKVQYFAFLLQTDWQVWPKFSKGDSCETIIFQVQQSLCAVRLVHRVPALLQWPYSTVYTIQFMFSAVQYCLEHMVLSTSDII